MAAAAACVGCAGDDEVERSVEPGRTVPTIGPEQSTAARLPGSVTGGISVGVLDDLDDALAVGAMYVPAARAWLVRVPDADLEAAREIADRRQLAGLEHGLVALHQKCPHLGCRVPFCESSEWFECPCHGSQFTRLGEHRSGPGPRGMDAFAVRVDGDEVLIDASELITGRPEGFVGVEQVPAGPHCVGVGDR